MRKKIKIKYYLQSAGTVPAIIEQFKYVGESENRRSEKRKMNRIEKAIVSKGKKILVKHVLFELAEYRKQLQEGRPEEKLLIDLLNSGIFINLKSETTLKIQNKVIGLIEKHLKRIVKQR